MKIELHLSVQNTTLTPKEMREFILRQEWPMAWEHKFNLFQMACPREVVAWVFVVLAFTPGAIRYTGYSKTRRTLKVSDAVFWFSESWWY